MIVFLTGLFTATYTLVSVYYIPILIYYTLGGIIYTILKWYLNIYKLRQKVLSSELITSLSKKDGSINEIIKEKKRLASSLFEDYSSYPPKLSENKDTLFWRAVFWPINLVWTLIGDVAINIWLFIYDKTTSFFQSISDRMLP